MGKLERTRPERRARMAGALVIATLLIGVPLGAVLGHGRGTRGHAGAWDAAVALGRQDFATGSCISCHALHPISAAGGAIDLTHEGSRRTLRWLQHEIRFPTSQRPPTPAGQEDDLAAFLSSLR